MVTHLTDGQCPSVQILASVPIFDWSSKPGGNVVEAGFKSFKVGMTVSASETCQLCACRRACSQLRVRLNGLTAYVSYVFL